MKLKVPHILAFASVLLVNASALAQGLSWSAPQSSTNTASPPGGLSGRPSISGVAFNGQIFAAEKVNDSSGEIMILTNNGGGTTFSNYGNVVTANRGTPYQIFAYTNVGPALTAVGGYLFLAYTDTNGLNHILSSQNGLDWTGPSAYTGTPGLPPNTQANPSIAADPATNTIYAAYTSGQYFTPIVCQWAPFSRRAAKLQSVLQS